ncbi:MAG: KH domain-containing protein [Clostridia bacterium]|jgi:spoIIIJ-associated protein|nr:KH domain-containing protein [Clostridia bacterium]
MERSIISEGKTTNEAIENGLKKLNVSKNMVDVKVLETEEKRSFFSILAPRVVKVQLTVKENKTSNEVVKKERKEIELSAEEQEKAKKNIEKFLNEFLEKVQKGAQYSINMSKDGLKIDIKDNNLGFLIGYRGETLYALQSILSSVASKDIENRVRVILDIEGYKSKREKALEDLAEKLAKTVVNTRKSVTLEPMQAYERKIIHAKLQSNNMVETRSIGEEPRRRIVISLKRK